MKRAIIAAFAGALVCAFTANAGLKFFQLTDPHLFGKEAGNERALRQAVQENNRRSANRGEFRFVVVTGDFGIEDLVSDKIEKAPTPTAAEDQELENRDQRGLKERRIHEAASKDCEKGARIFGDIIKACAVKKWLFVVGNNVAPRLPSRRGTKELRKDSTAC
jgi:hypothetical protein